MKPLLSRFYLIVAFISVLTISVNANISLPELFSDNMVLQQQSDVKIWGWAKTGETVIVKAEWLDSEMKVTVGNQGKWELTLKTPTAGGPYTIHLKGNNEIILKNVLIGEVWLCSGQSNMEMSAQWGINNSEEEIKNANYPNIRFYSVYHATSLYPQEHCTGEWVECTPETMKDFSAAGYFFARRLQEKLGVPVGIINSSWGGTPAEAWIPEEVITTDRFLSKAANLQKPVPWGPVENGRIYNAMIAPLIPFNIKGALWYQGEANTLNGFAYTEILSALIQSWRNKWEADFPFYFAQIAPYKYGKPLEGVIVRDAQRKVLEIPKTGMIVLSDIGDTTDIHPKNKQDVGLRFANMALNRVYKTTKKADSGPLYKEMSIVKNKALISFDYAEGLYTTGKKLSCFEIAGTNNIFHPADAQIKGQQVIVQSKKVKEPVKVRFAWGNTATPNLFNEVGLPASCFITE